MDVITAVLQAPVNTILIFAGIVIVFFALFEVGKGSVQLRSGKTNVVPVVVGAILILGGLLYKSSGAPSAEPAAGITISAATVTPVISSEATATTEAQTPTIVPSNTPEPTSTPEIKTLADGCIAGGTWQAISIDTAALNSISNQDLCLNLDALGISVERGGKLHFLATAPKAPAASGIFIPVGNESVIEFKISVKSLYIVYPDVPANITFSVSQPNDPMADRGSGRFKLRVEDNTQPALVYFLLADTTEPTGSKLETQHYSYGRTYSIRLELKSIYMQTYINDVKLNEEVTIPAGSKVFYIGYDLPILAGADVEISDIKVDGKTP